MTIEVTCTCGRKVTAPNNMAGRRVQCFDCNRFIDIPGTPPAVNPMRSATRVYQFGIPVGVVLFGLAMYSGNTVNWAVAVLWCFLFVPLADALAALSIIAENSDRARAN